MNPDNFAALYAAERGHFWFRPPTRSWKSAAEENSMGIVELNRAILRDNGIELDQDAFILDYGCGSGRDTYAYRDAGYRNAFGYDILDYLDPRAPDDATTVFRLDKNSNPVGSYPAMSGVPWPDNTFDFIFATTVFEHVMDQERAYREVARVLKPGGCFLNNFPSKWKPIEPHMYVPFGGVTQNRSWFEFWAARGIRNEFQQGMSARETAERNHSYSINGINYLGGAEIDRMLGGIFSENRYVEQSFVRHSPGKSRYLAAPLNLFPPLAKLFRFAHFRIILSRK
jgi:SAM-dependent methyltransferase